MELSGSETPLDEQSNFCRMVNTTVLTQELDWLQQVIDLRFSLYFDTEEPPVYDSVYELEPPLHEACDYADVVQSLELDFGGRLAIALCLAVHLEPQMFDVFFTRNHTFPSLGE